MRFLGIDIKNGLPMEHFTPKEPRPREQTLDIIRQLAYTYRPARLQGLQLN